MAIDHSVMHQAMRNAVALAQRQKRQEILATMTITGSDGDYGRILAQMAKDRFAMQIAKAEHYGYIEVGDGRP